MSEVIAILNPKTGEISYEVNGVLGASCKNITDLLRQGLEVIEENETEEIYLTEEPEYIENM